MEQHSKSVLKQLYVMSLLSIKILFCIIIANILHQLFNCIFIIRIFAVLNPFFVDQISAYARAAHAEVEILPEIRLIYATALTYAGPRFAIGKSFTKSAPLL